jgi:hypothetical protein
MLTLVPCDLAPGSFHTSYGPSYWTMLYKVYNHGDYSFAVFAESVVWC